MVFFPSTFYVLLVMKELIQDPTPLGCAFKQTKTCNSSDVKILNRVCKAKATRFHMLPFQSREIPDYSLRILQWHNNIGNSASKAAKQLQRQKVTFRLFFKLKHFTVWIFSVTPQIAVSEELKDYRLCVSESSRLEGDGGDNFTAVDSVSESVLWMQCKK